MNKKIVKEFLMITFLIMAVFWGSCLALQKFGITASDYLWMYLPFLFGGWSVTIASYIVLKKNDKVPGIRSWLRAVFDVKKPVRLYLFAIALSAVSFLPSVFVAGISEAQPFYMFFASLPLMLIGGGLEEPGWRYVLQPELEKKFGFAGASIIVGLIWAVWHLPLFFITSAGQYGDNFGLFAIGVLGLSFALGAVRRISGGVFLCVLLHTLHNSWVSTYTVDQTLPGQIVSTALLIVISIIAVIVHKDMRKRIQSGNRVGVFTGGNPE
jgi:membrane protease YdiL (CAAX protease family)